MPSKADELFRRAKSHNAHNLGTLSIVIDALCENGLEDIIHVDKAKQYLLDFEAEKMKMSRFLVSPDMKYTKMYNAVIAGYLGCDTKKRGLEQADALLEHMISSHESNPRHIARPNTTSFARLMSALSQRGDNTRRLEVLLKKMEALNNRRKSVLKNSKDAELVANVVPNIVCYNTLLKSYARSNDDDALQSAMKLLGRMEADPDIKPDDISNSYILALLSRKNDADVSDTTSSGETVKYVSHALTNHDVDSLPFDDLNLNGRNDPTSKSFNSIMNGKLFVCTPLTQYPRRFSQPWSCRRVFEFQCMQQQGPLMVPRKVPRCYANLRRCTNLANLASNQVRFFVTFYLFAFLCSYTNILSTDVSHSIYGRHHFVQQAHECMAFV